MDNFVGFHAVTPAGTTRKRKLFEFLANNDVLFTVATWKFQNGLSHFSMARP
jgi:hypothetical protein